MSGKDISELLLGSFKSSLGSFHLVVGETSEGIAAKAQEMNIACYLQASFLASNYRSPIFYIYIIVQDIDTWYRTLANCLNMEPKDSDVRVLPWCQYRSIPI